MPFVYSTVPGYFLQDDAETSSSDFDSIASNFGLKPWESESDSDLADGTAHAHAQSQWQRFEHEVRRLNRHAGQSVCYKVLYLGRHGQGVHNVAEKLYTTPEWNRYWALQPGDETLDWTDAHLTELGIEQARMLNAFWKRKMVDEKIPLPESYYTSPLHRCMATAAYTFADLALPEDKPFKPIVKELLRELIGRHYCDHRSAKSFLQSEFPAFAFEPGFRELDPFWTPDERESNEAVDARMKALLDDVFASDESVFMSFTSHSLAISSILRVLGHREFRVAAGSVVPVLVKVEKVEV